MKRSGGYEISRVMKEAKNQARKEVRDLKGI